jgi:hypothetical protein
VVASRRLRPLLALTAATTLLVVSPAPSLAARARPRVDEIQQSLAVERSYKVRVEAALILGRLKDRRSVPSLVSALGDNHPAVRATAAQALGRIGDPVARDALVRARQDSNRFVRRMANEALRALPAPSEVASASAARASRRPAFDIKPMGDRSRKATAALRGRMRDLVASHLSSVGDIAAADQQPGFVVDGAIKELSMTTGPDIVRIGCAVQLVVSRHPTGGVFLLTSGEARVEKPIHQFKPQQKEVMEIEALENAVRGASEDLVASLRRP